MALEKLVYVDGKAYRRGYTTGSCSAAAAKAATLMLLRQVPLEYITIDTPKGISLTLKVEEPVITESYAQCAIVKDGGDDADVTSGMKIYANVSFIEEPIVQIEGGIGIGKVTQNGLELSVGEAAINKVPRQMIAKEVSEVAVGKGVKVIIFAPEGVSIGKKTFNPRLGIEGGISIIGTTGIVEPMSEEGFKEALSVELKMKRAQGYEQIVLVPGNQGERFCQQELKLPKDCMVQMSNFVGYMLQECKRLGFKKILIVGPLGKLIKVAAGIFHTHSKMADGRKEIMISHLALMGVALPILQEIDECVTTQAMSDIIEREGLEAVYLCLVKEIRHRCLVYLNVEEQSLELEVILFSLGGAYLCSSIGAQQLVEALR